jgi:drug/metabolite transporter (DMT)-like permease
MARRLLIIAAFASIYLLWGSTYFAIALGLKSIPPFLLMALRSFCGGLTLVTINGRGIDRLSLRDWLNAGLCGLLFFVGCHGTLAYAQQMVPSGAAAIVLATIPFWILLIDWLSPKGERPSPVTLLTLVPGFFGVGLVAWQDTRQAGTAITPIVLLLGAACSWSIATVLSRGNSGSRPATLMSGAQLLAGGAALFAISFATGEWHSFSPAHVSFTSLEAALYLIIAGSVIGFAAYHWLLANVSTSLVSTYTFVNPIIAVLLGVYVLGEPFSKLTLLGTCLVVVSVAAMWLVDHFAPKTQPQFSPSGCAAGCDDLRHHRTGDDHDRDPARLYRRAACGRA